MIRVAVIAGTPVDTKMGVDYILSRQGSTESGSSACGREAGAGDDARAERYRILPVYMPVSEDCDDQIRFQYSDEADKRRRIGGIFDEAIADGIRDFFIYCNSLSGAFDFDRYEKEKSEELGFPIRIYTPLQVYRSLGSRHGRIGVMAANNLSAYSIEKTLMEVYDSMYVIGSGNMAVVHAIEEGIAPGEIVSGFGLDRLTEYMAMNGCEALVLGCTHFPYFRAELAECCSIPLIDPADEMYQDIIRRNRDNSK